jgi:hypothetical protein
MSPNAVPNPLRYLFCCQAVAYIIKQVSNWRICGVKKSNCLIGFSDFRKIGPNRAVTSACTNRISELCHLLIVEKKNNLLSCIRLK